MKTETDNLNVTTPIFGSKEMLNASPVDEIPQHGTAPRIAYQMVKDETFPQTQPRLNLATFVTTYMDDYATKLMNEAININFIDETEYPRVAMMSAKCINIIAKLWNTPEQAKWKAGALAIGSSEACMLGGVAAWLRWRERRKAAGKPFDKPNFVISSGYQVVWEKFAQLWQIEMRTVPLSTQHPTLDPQEALKMCDENTICIVPIQGVTWTGLNDDVEAIDKALDEYNAKTGYEVCIHVDAASGGFILPFLDPDNKWDFRLKWVLSISTSGHKYGLVYPGLGWVIWKDKKYLPGSMSFSVNYLGAEVTQVGLNFSRPAAQVLGQYYQFIRLGFEGYKAVQSNSMKIAQYTHDQIGKMGPFVNYSDQVVNPLFIWSLKPEYAKKAKWTLYDLQAKLQESGWMVPAYTLPANLEETVVMRVVVKEGFSMDMADMLLTDMQAAVAELEKLEYPTPTRVKQDRQERVAAKVFTHTGRPKDCAGGKCKSSEMDRKSHNMSNQKSKAMNDNMYDKNSSSMNNNSSDQNQNQDQNQSYGQTNSGQGSYGSQSGSNQNSNQSAGKYGQTSNSDHSSYQQQGQSQNSSDRWSSSDDMNNQNNQSRKEEEYISSK